MNQSKHNKGIARLRIFTFPQNRLDPFLVAKCLEKHASSTGLDVELLDKDIISHSLYPKAAALILTGKSRKTVTEFMLNWRGGNYHIEFPENSSEIPILINKIFIEEMEDPTTHGVKIDWLNSSRTVYADFLEGNVLDQFGDRGALRKSPFLGKFCHKSLTIEAKGLQDSEYTISLFLPFDFEKKLEWPIQTLGILRTRNIHNFAKTSICRFLQEDTSSAVLEYDGPEPFHESLILPESIANGEQLPRLNHSNRSFLSKTER